MVTPETTRKDVLSVFRCGAHLINSTSGRDINDPSCFACGEWIGDVEDPESRHVSLSLMHPGPVACRACAETMEALDSQLSTEHPGGVG